MGVLIRRTWPLLVGAGLSLHCGEDSRKPAEGTPCETFCSSLSACQLLPSAFGARTNGSAGATGAAWEDCNARCAADTSTTKRAEQLCQEVAREKDDWCEMADDDLGSKYRPTGSCVALQACLRTEFVHPAVAGLNDASISVAFSDEPSEPEITCSRETCCEWKSFVGAPATQRCGDLKISSIALVDLPHSDQLDPTQSCEDMTQGQIALGAIPAGVYEPKVRILLQEASDAPLKCSVVTGDPQLVEAGGMSTLHVPIPADFPRNGSGRVRDCQEGEVPEVECRNGVDEDGDQLFDCAEALCAGWCQEGTGGAPTGTGGTDAPGGASDGVETGGMPAVAGFGGEQ